MTAVAPETKSSGATTRQRAGLAAALGLALAYGTSAVLVWTDAWRESGTAFGVVRELWAAYPIGTQIGDLTVLVPVVLAASGIVLSLLRIRAAALVVWGVLAAMAVLSTFYVSWNGAGWLPLVDHAWELLPPDVAESYELPSRVPSALGYVELALYIPVFIGAAGRRAREGAAN